MFLALMVVVGGVGVDETLMTTCCWDNAGVVDDGGDVMLRLVA